MHKVKQIRVLDGCRLALTFADGTHGVADLSDLAGKGVFSAWNDQTVFAQAAVGEAGEVFWPGGLDLCPDSLYLRITGRKPEDIFPSLTNEPAHA